MDELTLEVQRREETGTGPNRRLRKAGLLPAVVYGGGKDPISIQVDQKSIHRLLREVGGENAVFLLKLGGTDQSRHTMVRKIDVDPISRQISHIDFQRIDMTKKVKVQVNIEIVGEALGVRTEDGVLDFISRTIEVECLPDAIPAAIEVDVTDLHTGQHLEVSDLAVSEGVTIVDDLSKVIVSIGHARVAEVAEEAEEDLLLEGESEQPEVIGRGKDEEESGESAG
ncbi:MAG: 50S ribosomal protein L25 [Acidobacteria bacterium]|nr:50S ribosomal protein L25 [Acidobacteriota bacterium]